MPRRQQIAIAHTQTSLIDREIATFLVLRIDLVLIQWRFLWFITVFGHAMHHKRDSWDRNLYYHLNEREKDRQQNAIGEIMIDEWHGY